MATLATSSFSSTDSSYYAHLYNKVVFEAIQRKSGPDSGALFARSATAGGQRFPIHWGGDCGSTFEAMAESIRGGLSLTSSGFAFWSHDIGGFEVGRVDCTREIILISRAFPPKSCIADGLLSVSFHRM
jgi:alpha-glucosidase (family GH31 glycosyl hydrolase)